MLSLTSGPGLAKAPEELPEPFAETGLFPFPALVGQARRLLHEILLGAEGLLAFPGLLADILSLIHICIF